jgi:hypothetical protein
LAREVQLAREALLSDPPIPTGYLDFLLSAGHTRLARRQTVYPVKDTLFADMLKSLRSSAFVSPGCRAHCLC